MVGTTVHRGNFNHLWIKTWEAGDRERSRKELAVLCCNALCVSHGLSKPSFFNPLCTSGQLMKSFHNNPVR